MKNIEKNTEVLDRLSEILWQPETCKFARKKFLSKSNCDQQCDICVFGSLQSIYDMLDRELNGSKSKSFDEYEYIDHTVGKTYNSPKEIAKELKLRPSWVETLIEEAKWKGSYATLENHIIELRLIPLAQAAREERPI